MVVMEVEMVGMDEFGGYGGSGGWSIRNKSEKKCQNFTV